MRILGEQAKVSSDEIRRGRISHNQFQDVVEASKTLENLKLYIDDTPAISVSQLRTRARRLLRSHGRLDMIVVDYIQLMQPGAGAPPGKPRAGGLGNHARPQDRCQGAQPADSGRCPKLLPRGGAKGGQAPAPCGPARIRLHRAGTPMW